MSLSESSIRRPVTALMLCAAVVILGIVAYRNLGVDFLPPISIPRLTILTVCTDASPEEIESSVTQPVETAVGTLHGVKRISSISRDGSSVVTVEFTWGTDMDLALLDAREKLDVTRSEIPADAGRPTIFHIDPSSEPIMTLALWMVHDSAKGGSVPDLIELKEIARSLIKRRIEQVEGVAQASVLGGVDRRIEVCLEMPKLVTYGLSPGNVARALARSNLSSPGGTITEGSLRYPLRTLGEFTSLDEIRNVVAASTSSGRPVRVREIGTVRDTISGQKGFIRSNGREVIAIEIRKTPGENTVEISRKVHSVLDELRAASPRLCIGVLSEQAELIHRSTTDVEGAMVVGGILAFIVLFLFLRNAHYTLIIGLAMPVSVIATFLAMYLFDIDLNVISLTGLALGIGMLGDNATVMIENISRLREEGATIIEATRAGTREISAALSASTLTNVAIFLPVVFVEGAASRLFVAMGATMTISLLVSLCVSATLVPMLVSRTGKHSPRSFGSTSRESPHRCRGERMGRAAYVALDSYLIWSIRHRGVVLAASGLALAGAAVTASLIPVEPAPDIDRHGLSVQVGMPRGTQPGRLLDVVASLENEFLRLPGVLVVDSRIGITDDLTLWTAGDASVESGVIDVRVDERVPTQSVIDAVRDILGRLRSTTAGGEFEVRRRESTLGNLLYPGEADVKIAVLGNDLAAGVRIAREIIARAPRLPDLVDLRLSTTMDRPEYRVTVDRDAASRRGLSVDEVAGHITGLLRGIESTSLSGSDGKTTVRVVPEHTGELRITDVLSSTIIAGGTAVPLRTLTRIEHVAGFSEIRHEGGERAVVLSGNMRGMAVAAAMEELRELLRTVQLPAGSCIVLGGRIEESNDSFKSLLIAGGLAILLVYMILAAEYESLLLPMIILLTSPLAFIGTIVSMAIAGQGFNIMSMTGIVIMIGAVDNDAVIAVDMMANLRREGLPMETAIRRGMHNRLRPILMTTATTVLGVIPLVSGIGAGSGFVQALAIPLVGGMLASTFFTIVAIPAVFSYVGNWSRRGR